MGLLGLVRREKPKAAKGRKPVALKRQFLPHQPDKIMENEIQMEAVLIEKRKGNICWERKY